MNEDALWLDAAIDDELDAARSLALAERLARDPEFRAAWEARRALRAQVREEATRHAAPEALRARLAALTSVPSPRRASRRPWWPLAASALGGALAATLATVAVIDPAARHAREDTARLDAEAVGEHARATLTDQAIEVASSDRHTVRPWLAARLSFVPPVVDLAPQGFPLAGARRDVLGGETAAVLVYRHGPHTVSVFVQPAAGDAAREAAPVLRVERGFNVVEMRHAAMRWRLVSDMGVGEIQQLAELLKEHAS